MSIMELGAFIGLFALRGYSDLSGYSGAAQQGGDGSQYAVDG